MIDNKRGQGLSTNAIILIILGVVVLVVLIAGFTMGWGSLKDLLGSSNNVATIVQSCSTACATNSVYDYCSMNRTLKATDLPGGVKSFEQTCSFLANKSNGDYTKYGIEDCLSICP